MSSGENALRDRMNVNFWRRLSGGRGGIRTHVRIAPKPDFESGAFNHSATLPAGSKCLNHPGQPGKF